MRPESTSSGSLPGVSAAVCVTPLALVAGLADRAVAPPFGLASFDLALFGLDLAALAFALPGFSALAAFFAALPLPALAVSAALAATAGFSVSADFAATASGRAVSPAARA